MKLGNVRTPRAIGVDHPRSLWGHLAGPRGKGAGC